jgi:hypothetical protein
MYFDTMERMKYISQVTGFTVKYIWGHEYDKIKLTQSCLVTIIHNCNEVNEFV